MKPPVIIKTPQMVYQGYDEQKEPVLCTFRFFGRIVVLPKRTAVFLSVGILASLPVQRCAPFAARNVMKAFVTGGLPADVADVIAVMSVGVTALELAKRAGNRGESLYVKYRHVTPTEAQVARRIFQKITFPG